MYTTNQKIKFLQKSFKDAVLMKDGVEAVVRCPSCGSPGKNKLCIRLDNYFYHCWVCDLKGRSLGWLLKKYRPEYLDEYVKNFEDASFKLNWASTEEKEELVELPQDFKLLATSTAPSARAIKNYLYSRGYTNKNIWRYRIGFSEEKPWNRRAIIPSFDAEGKLNYYTGRAIDKSAFIKYLNVKIPRNSLIFNEIDLDWKKPIVLVEGPLDLLRCPENSTCLLGSYLSTEYKLFEQIAINQTPVWLILDDDAIKKAHKIAKLFVQYNIPVRMGQVSGRDIGEMHPSEVLNVIQNAPEWNNMFALKSKIKNIKSGSVL